MELVDPLELGKVYLSRFLLPVQVDVVLWLLVQGQVITQPVRNM
jgi:hypothetical protein